MDTITSKHHRDWDAYVYDQQAIRIYRHIQTVCWVVIWHVLAAAIIWQM